MSTYLTKGIILKQTDRAEADQLFNIYTQDRGKIIALGRATKKIQSKLNPSLQQFAVLELMIAPGKKQDHIAAVKIEENFLNLKSDLKKIVLGYFALELVDKLTRLDGADSRAFSLLCDYLSALNSHDFEGAQWLAIKQTFVVKFLTLLGLEPEKDIAADPKKLENFLQHQLDGQLQTEQFLFKIAPLT